MQRTTSWSEAITAQSQKSQKKTPSPPVAACCVFSHQVLSPGSLTRFFSHQVLSPGSLVKESLSYIGNISSHKFFLSQGFSQGVFLSPGSLTRFPFQGLSVYIKVIYIYISSRKIFLSHKVSLKVFFCHKVFFSLTRFQVSHRVSPKVLFLKDTHHVDKMTHV